MAEKCRRDIDKEGNGLAEHFTEPKIEEISPIEINITKFVESRVQEIRALDEHLKNTRKEHKTACQNLPRHMRRRAASHNAKRVPRRIRMAVERDMVKNKRKVIKRPSRRYRRRPKNLLQEYNRRKRKHIWLETHIWHAKRFHMEELWGYKVPLHPNTKIARTAYRASVRGCLLFDLSYNCCIEIEGTQSDIISRLDCMTSDETGCGFAWKSFVDGRREGRTVLYSCQSYPLKALGEVKFIWKPINNTFDKRLVGNENTEPTESDADVITCSNTRRQLWLWVHPSCYEVVWKELRNCLNVAMPTEEPQHSEENCKEKIPKPLAEEKKCVEGMKVKQSLSKKAGKREISSKEKEVDDVSIGKKKKVPTATLR